MMLNDAEKREMKLELFKSAFLSAVYSLFQSRRNQAVENDTKYLMQDLANDAGVTKSQVSRWFNGELSPNWRLSTLFDLIEALDGDVRFEIVDRLTNKVHGSSGLVAPRPEETYSVLESDPVYAVGEQGQVVDLNQYMEGLTLTSPRDPVYYAAGDAPRATAAA